ncbi:MAG: arylsulfatase [Planctomycetaceae bacterium]|nr:arylsulfatase [Planctomycetaceae bacterium]
MQPFPYVLIAIATAVRLTLSASAAQAQNQPPDRDQPPNIVLIMSDDQGYGDFGATGNPLIETPNIDAMAARSASMDTFYVSPVCSPTRACLMTGRYNYRTRCIDTYMGRSMMDPDEVTIAEVLRDAGYATGIFGKWHLGDSYPLRAVDQGFEESLIHKGGGLAQPSEPLENQRRYTDAILFHNGEPVESHGFCTDVYFDAAMEFIDQAHAAHRRFFVYLPTNAPHGPFHDVPTELYEHYRKKDFSLLEPADGNTDRRPADGDTLARIAAMITNIDQNVGRLFDHLGQMGITDNTIVIYMVDNGPNTQRYVGPFRGNKSNVYDGGIRSPFWMHWPAQLAAGAASSVPAAHIDVLPTLLDACGVAPPEGVDLDGRSFLPLLRGESAERPERYLAIQSHRGNVPVRYHQFMIRDNRWKLLHASGFGNEQFDGEPQFELYDLLADPGERVNLVAQHPAEAQRLQQAYDAWFDDVSQSRSDNYAPPRILVGTSHENPTILTQQDWRIETKGDAGHWDIQVTDAGDYDVTLLFNRPLDDGVAQIAFNDRVTNQQVKAGTTSVVFPKVSLAAGDATLEAIATKGDARRAPYHVIVERK